MNVGMYQGAGSLDSLDRWQGEISRNLASASAPGFKKTEMAFEGVLNGQLGRAARGALPGAADAQSPLPSSRTSFLNGQLTRTANPLNLALQTPGFFQVETANGVRYTRDGQFHRSPDNTLVTRWGEPLLAQDGPITLTPGAGDIAVDTEGRVSQGGLQIAELDIITFTDPEKLRPAAGGFVADVDNPPTPDDDAVPGVLQGYLESSNVSPILEMVNLVSVSRAQEANQKVLQHYDDLLERAIQSLGT